MRALGGLIRFLGLGLGMLAIAGCSGGNGAAGGGSFAVQFLAGLVTPAEDRPDLRAVLTPEAVAALGQPAILLSLPDRGQEAIAITVRQNGQTVTWASTDGVSVTLRGGAVLATRGLGGDLMVADLGEVLGGVRGARSEALRVHRYLDGEEQTVARAMICDFADGGTQSVELAFGSRSLRTRIEACVGPDWQFENHYWFDGSGRVVASRQWISPEIGHLRIESLSGQ